MSAGVKNLRSLAAACAFVCIAPVAAQTYPAKPVRLVVPFVPGGSTDLVARLLAQKLGEAWSQQVLVENRPGAGGNVGVEFVAKSAPDGYTLVFGHVGTFGFGPSLYPKLPYDPVADFAPVILFASVPNMIAVHPALPARTVKELIALARARPGQLNYGSSGNGSASHLATEYFKLLSKTDILAIAYKGTGPLVTDLIAGQTQLTITGVPPLAPHVQSGRLRGIAVANEQRVPTLPDMPTAIESGLPGYVVTTWFGPLAPARTPREIVVKMNAELMKILQRPEVKERFRAEGIDAIGGTPEQFGAYIKEEIARWAKVVTAAKIRPE
jgi:tripartite-type tricarboxylate transporter receptor subunit TctC